MLSFAAFRNDLGLGGVAPSPHVFLGVCLRVSLGVLPLNPNWQLNASCKDIVKTGKCRVQNSRPLKQLTEGREDSVVARSRSGHCTSHTNLIWPHGAISWTLQGQETTHTLLIASSVVIILGQSIYPKYDFFGLKWEGNIFPPIILRGGFCRLKATG